MASTYLDLRAITRCEAARSGDDRQAHHRLPQRMAFSETRHNRDIFLANTMAYGQAFNLFASILQVRLVRKLGPGLYLSWASFRTLLTMVLSAHILGEGISGLLEWLGVGLLVASMSVYLGETRKWLDRKSSEKLGGDDAWGEGTEDDGDEELVPIGREKRPLLAGDAG